MLAEGLLLKSYKNKNEYSLKLISGQYQAVSSLLARRITTTITTTAA